MLTKGTVLFQDLADLFGRKLPRSVALAFAGVVLLWPLALPYGAIWLPLYWSALLWGYASASERVVMVAVWLLLGAAPQLVELQRQRVAVALSPPALAMESLQEHRLYGSLFADLGLVAAGMSKPMPTEPPEGEKIAVFTPMTLPFVSNAGPPELPLLMGASIWM